MQEESGAGARILGVFIKPLNTQVLRAHADGPLRMAELQGKVGWAPEATVRGVVNGLREFGALEKRSAEGARNAVATALTPAGEEMLAVADVLERWLGACPKGPMAIDGEPGGVAIKALAEGWSSKMMRPLASDALTLTELSIRTQNVSYPALERRISWMRTTEQLVPLARQPHGTPYVPTDWLRRAISPIAVAGRCERRHMADAPPIGVVEIETAFLLSLPLVRLAKGMGGTCTLAVQIDKVDPEEPCPGVAGVAVNVADGKVTPSVAPLEGEPSSWVLGSPDDWLDAMIEGRLEILRVGGTRPQLAIDLVNSLHYLLNIDR